MGVKTHTYMHLMFDNFQCAVEVQPDKKPTKTIISRCTTQPDTSKTPQNGEAESDSECHLPNLGTVLKQKMLSDKCLVCNQDKATMICAQPVSVIFV